MLSSWFKSLLRRPTNSRNKHRRPAIRLRIEALEDRYMLAVSVVTVTSVVGPSTSSVTVPVATEGQLASPSLNAAFTDTNTTLTAAQYNVTINYGDGTTPVTNVSPAPAGTVFDANLAVTGSAGNFSITDKHTFPEESGSTVPPGAFTVNVTVTENITSGASGAGSGTAEVLDAPLSPGNPITVPVAGAATFFGGNTGNATSATAALANFEAGIGGVKNTAATPQTGGFRVINWDGVKTDGTDSAAGPNSTVVITPHTVGIPLDRFEGSGVFFGAVYAVSNDGFVDVNPNVGAPNPVLFPASSAPNTFAMFNDNGIDFKFVAPSATNSALVSAASRGFGSIFLNVQQPGTTITYFHGNTVLATLNVPVNSTAGAAVFAGELFPSAIVTNVLLTLGQGVIFKFDGTSVTSGSANSATNNLVAVDDWAFAEPVPIANGFPITSGSGGTTNAPVLATASSTRLFSGPVATFSDADPNGNAKDFTATINWGDGHLTNGTITANGSGGFTVSGSNTYAAGGSFPITVDIADFGGGPGVAGSQPTLSISNTLTVLDANHSFVQALYNDFLGRSGSFSELDGWAGQLLTLGQQGVAKAISHSQEALKFAVDGFYVKYLGRAAGNGEEAGMVTALQNGMTEEQIIAGMLSSPEFAAHANTLPGAGSDADTNYIQALYKLLLNRTGSATEVKGWLTVLPTLGRTTVALDFLASSEFRIDAVTSYYADLLDRTSAPSAAEVSGWVNGGLDILSIQTAFAGTSEYFVNG